MPVTTVLTNLGNGTGKIYQVKPSGAIDTFANTSNTVRNILDEAVKSRIIYEAQAVDTFDFTDPVYGSTFWLNDSALAPVHDITDALEITDYLILDSRNDLLDGNIVAGDVEVTRRSRMTIIPLTPEVGLTDDLISLSGDLLIGDMVVLLPKGGGATFVITIKDMDGDGVVGGNFALHNGQDITLNGTNDVCLFLKNADAIKEIARPDSALLDVANKTMSAGGGSYYCLDPSGGAARIKTKRGLVVLNGGATLAAPWTVWGENGGDTPISQGVTLEVILDSPLYTDTLNGNGLTIFGIEVPNLLCLYNNFVVRAWYNDSDIDPLNWGWEARLYVSQMDQPISELFNDGSGDNPFDLGTDFSSDRAYYYLEPTFNSSIKSWVTLIGNVTTNASCAVGSSLDLGSSPNPDFWSIFPNQFVCVVYHIGSGEWGSCVVTLSGDADMTLTVFPITDSIGVGDTIYLDGIRYATDYSI